MDVGVGLPSHIPGVTGEEVLEAARRAEAAGFHSLGVIDRIVYDNLEPLVALAAVAAVTERVRLTTSILIVPNRANAALVAKQAASVDVLSGGRLTLGVGLGGREDDYEVSGVPVEGRGQRLDEMLEEMQGHWRGDELGPRPVQEGGPPLWLGGMVDAAYERAARFGAGWIMGGGTPDQLAEGAKSTRQAFRDAGREEEPRIGALIYFALGEDAEAATHRNLTHYYAWLGQETAEMIASSAATDEETVKTYLEAFEAAGCDEAILFPTSGDPEQVDLLARVAL